MGIELVVSVTHRLGPKRVQTATLLIYITLDRVRQLVFKSHLNDFKSQLNDLTEGHSFSGLMALKEASIWHSPHTEFPLDPDLS
jgi:hypothetical protein